MPAKKTKKPSPSKSSSEYKYVPPSTSPFYQHVISPLCDRLCELLVPPTLHPDWLTFLGLLCALSSAGLFALGAHAGCAVLWIVYGLLDNMDGKQARRSRQSSPGGEFFDHTCDAFMTTLAAVLMRESLAPSLRTSLGPGIALGFVASVQGVYILGTWAHALLGRVLLGTCVQSTDWLTVDEMNFFVIPIFVLARGYMPVLPDFRPPLPLGTFSSWLFSLPLPPSLQSLWFSFLSGGGEGGQLPGDAWVRFLSLGTCMVLFMIGFTIVGTANLLFLIFQWSALLQFLVIPSFVSTVSPRSHFAKNELQTLRPGVGSCMLT
mmetsp:Transcript_42689/g.84209  ORF Transcript_42689/g.84209 Transcript_42689/m.84209 type:complete len:320 (-) Transcript_42689:80-1039(-)